MANKNLGSASYVSNMLLTNSVLVEVGGSVRRIKLSDLMNAVNEGNEQLLRQVAWGVPLQPSGVSGTNWGRVGNLGMWEEYKRSGGRYLVTNDGRAAKLSNTYSGVYADGTTLDESKGHIMCIHPRLYFLVKRDAVSGNDYLWMSQLPIGGHYIEQSVTGAYMGSVVGGALTSRSGLVPTGSRQITSFWSAAQANGKHWGLCDYNTYQKKIVMHGLSEYGDSNIQARLGNGVCGSENKDLWATASQLKTGATKSLGDGFGKISISVVNGSNVGVNCSRVNLLGTEDPYGWFWHMLQGCYYGNSGNAAQTGKEVFIYEGNRMPTSSELANHPSGNYRQLTRLTTSNYINKLVLGEFFDIIPSQHGGGSTSGWADYNYANDTGQLCLWGGSAYAGSDGGLVYSHSSYAFSYSSSSFGARLAYYGPITFVDGKDIA